MNVWGKIETESWVKVRYSEHPLPPIFQFLSQLTSSRTNEMTHRMYNSKLDTMTTSCSNFIPHRKYNQMTTAPKEIRLENIQNSVTSRPNIRIYHVLGHHLWRLVLRTSEVQEMSKNPYLFLKFAIRPYIYLYWILQKFRDRQGHFWCKKHVG